MDNEAKKEGRTNLKMILKKLMRKPKYLPIVILFTAILMIAVPYEVKIVIQKFQPQAIASNNVEIVGQYLKIDNQNLDIKKKPALFIDATCKDILSSLVLIPSEKRPYIIVAADQQPDFMPPGVDYYWTPDTGTSSPSLVWYDQKLIGYMYSAVNPLIKKMRYPILIGKGKIDNRLSNGSTHNAVKAAEQINGAVLKPGETFSFYDFVVPSVENGYAEGLTLFHTKNGSQWLPDIGGGICRTSTALHFAVQNAQLEVIERHAHSKRVSYADPGEDTSVTRSGGWDYRFRNTTDKPIQIIGTQNGDALEFKIYQIFDTKDA